MWIQDLTQECIEPNPGPSWYDIKKTLVETKLGGQERVNKFFSSHLKQFEEELYGVYPLEVEVEVEVEVKLVEPLE